MNQTLGRPIERIGSSCATTTETRQTEQCQTSSHAGSGKGSCAGIYLNLVPGETPARRWPGLKDGQDCHCRPCSPAPSTASSRHGTRPDQPASGISNVESTFPPAANPASSADARRHVLPKDLPNAVKHLNDEELDRLLAVTLAEAKRRGRQSSPTDQPSPNPERGSTGVSLTRGQLNAVRAAFKAGITPARIARQFGLSQSAVRMALKSHKGE